MSRQKQTPDNTAPVRFSVVIPTLGGAQISRTIEQINQGSVRPHEILVCIPEAEAHRVAGLPFDNVRIVPTPVRGQVAQRAFGFAQVESSLVMQLDDDIMLDHDAVATLLSALTALGPGHIVGPVLYNVETGAPLSTIDTGFKGFVINVYESLIRGLPWGKRRMGALSDIGGCGSVDPRLCDEALVSTEWLPGGCSVSYRDELVLDAFFPYPGKAFSEDVLHSTLRTRKGIVHHVAVRAKATIQPPERGVTRYSALAEIRARQYAARMLGGNPVRAYLASVLDILRRQIAALLAR
ncbi:glycosyltransferase family 2 protein [Nitrogeniibacter mangrovi]|uniref:Glycosyltransferase family 2 protein n=1 Tax=Nitrogeniibacter mangrovi TaxID=2016596 RepID=A0A6C1B066_9RHOO|nr:glycosyltransferase family 2 protein [Nitrogeniibacter mangrovi]QID16992.1 glycosyltransferase family 2 protein [Nitrogeniibacter mangrovi]